MHLRYCLMTANIDCKEDRHAQVVMKELGIKYFHSTPQSMGDQWWFWCCEGEALNNLPKYLTELDLDPMKCIGFGLIEHNAKAIRDKIIEMENK